MGKDGRRTSRQRRHARVRARVQGTGSRLRLCVGIYLHRLNLPRSNPFAICHGHVRYIYLDNNYVVVNNKSDDKQHSCLGYYNLSAVQWLRIWWILCKFLQTSAVGKLSTLRVEPRCTFALLRNAQVA